MVSAKLLNQLQSPLPNERKNAIKAIAQTKDPDALPHLAQVFRNDDDPEIRELARKAGVYIKKNAPPKQESPFMDSGSAAAMGGAGLYADEDDEEPAPLYDDSLYADAGGSDDDASASHQTFVEVSENDRRRANIALQEALDMHMRGKEDRAWKAINMAFTLDPNLRRDSYALGIASDITGLGGNAAVKAALDYNPRTQKKKRSEKSKNDGGPKVFDPYEVTWGDAIVDLFIYGLVNAGIIALVFIGLFVWLNSLFNDPTFQAEMQQAGIAPISTADLQAFINTVGIPIVLLYSGIVAVFSIIGLLIQYFAIHIAATMIMDGDGTFPGLVRKLTLFLAFMYAISIALSVATVVIPLINPELSATLWGVYLLFSLAMLIQTGNLIGQAYNFSVLYGCATLALGWFLLVIIMCACQFMLSNAMMNATMGAF